MINEGTDNSEKKEGQRESCEETDVIWKKILEADSNRVEVYRRLSAQFPMLTKTDRRICVLLREDLFSWQIAKLLKVKDHTIENHRTRIRKKLKILRDHDLGAFFKGY